MLALCQLKNILTFKLELYNLMFSNADTRITELNQGQILTSILNMSVEFVIQLLKIDNIIESI